MHYEERWFRESVADTDAEAWHDPRGPLIDDQDFSFVERNLWTWYRDALDERTRQAGRACGLSERAIEALIPPRS